MPDLFLRMESIPVKGTDCSKVHFYRCDSISFSQGDVWEGTMISSCLVPNELVDDLSWCGTALRIVLANLLGQRYMDTRHNGVD